MNQIINDLLKQNDIKLKKWRTTDTGVAYPKSREIEIPKPISIRRFCTCLHEIEHIINPKAQRPHPAYLKEYIACTQSELKCKEYGFEIPIKELKRNTNYVKMVICKGLVRHGDINKIPTHILAYANINKVEWEQQIKQGLKPFTKCVKGAWEEVEVEWYK